MSKCDLTMVSKAVKDHTHTCTGDHRDQGHYCAGCKRWWWRKEDMNK